MSWIFAATEATANEPFGLPLIRLSEGMTAAQCRSPSRVPDSVEVADAELPCRQMKIVQQRLNTMVDAQTFPGRPEMFEPVVPDPPEEEGADCDIECLYIKEKIAMIEAEIANEEVVNICLSASALPQQTIEEHNLIDDDAINTFCNALTSDADRRRQALIGPYYATHRAHYANEDGLCDIDCTFEAIEAFGGTLRSAFVRLIALATAATIPLDRDDQNLNQDWWWELPEPYRAQPFLANRSAMIIEDINMWIQKAGLWVFANAGTEDGFNNNGLKDANGNFRPAPGDYDFILLELINFMYALKDRPDLLSDESVRALVFKRWDQDQADVEEFFKANAVAMPAAWADTNVPFAGQNFAREMIAAPDIPAFGGADDDLIDLDTLLLSETENHVLMTLVHYYLMNQWISEDYRDNLEDVTAQDGFDSPTQWYAYEGTSLERTLRDVIARVTHKGFFETNARPYQHYSMHALLVLASFAENPLIRTEAENALHYLTTKFTFQSLDGRRTTPSRRNCEYAHWMPLHGRDGTSFWIGLLSGAMKWNDSPYGMRPSLIDPNACFVDGATDCHWPEFNGKKDRTGNDSLGEAIAANGNELNDDTIDAGFTAKAIWGIFSRYRLPRPVHAFLLKRPTGYYARMMAQFDRKHYFPGTVSDALETGALLQFPVQNFNPEAALEIGGPRYFEGSSAADSTTYDNERVPEFYFGADGIVNVAGGIYNPYMFTLENGYRIPFNPLGPGCNGAEDFKDDALKAQKKKTENYDGLSRPYTILTEVPTVMSPVQGTGNQPIIDYYRPFGIDSKYTLEALNDQLPMMRGDSVDWFKSANSSTYKNFSYGYRVRRTGSLAGWGAYALLGGGFPQDLAKKWLDCSVQVDDFIEGVLPDESLNCPAPVPYMEFAYGTSPPLSNAKSALFRLYDLRAFHQAQGQSGFLLITARVRKYLRDIYPWSQRVARGFWEIVPARAFDADLSAPAILSSLRAGIEALNNPNGFKLGVIGDDKDFSYRLFMSRETLRLDQRYGAVWQRWPPTLDEGRVQGIIGIQEPDGTGVPRSEVFQEFMDEPHMNDLPLIDVKALDSSYAFLKDENNSYIYYACARNGWLYVNNPDDGSWLFLDSRRGAGFEDDEDLPTPYWQFGTFSDDQPWAAQCGGTGSGGWNPSPPDNGVPTDCSGEESCPEPPPGDDPDDGQDSDGGDGSGCVPSFTTCLTPSQCQHGQICALIPGADSQRRCTCPRPRRADLVPLHPFPTELPGGIDGEGLPGFYFCLPQIGGGASDRVQVRVRNIGAALAGPSTVTIGFNDGSVDTSAIGELAPNEEAMRVFNIPQACAMLGSCGFEVTVDSEDEVVEENGANNRVSSHCVEPQG